METTRPADPVRLSPMRHGVQSKDPFNVDNLEKASQGRKLKPRNNRLIGRDEVSHRIAELWMQHGAAFERL
jgi:hypothetical protein